MELKDQRDEGYWNSEKRESWRTGHLKRSSDLPPAQVDLTERASGTDNLRVTILPLSGLYWPGLPRWLRGKESACQCRDRRRLRFDPWVRGDLTSLNVSCIGRQVLYH